MHTFVSISFKKEEQLQKIDSFKRGMAYTIGTYVSINGKKVNLIRTNIRFISQYLYLFDTCLIKYRLDTTNLNPIANDNKRLFHDLHFQLNLVPSTSTFLDRHVVDSILSFVEYRLASVFLAPSSHS